MSCFEWGGTKFTNFNFTLINTYRTLARKTTQVKYCSFEFMPFKNMYEVIQRVQKVSHFYLAIYNYGGN